MRYLSMLGVALFSVAALASSQHSLIVGGTDADTKDFPYMVSFQTADFNGHFCGGTLIKKNWVITAAHCADYITNSTIYVGLYKQDSKDGVEQFTAKKVVVHPKNDSSNQDFDFALVQLSGDSKATPLDINRDEIKIPDGKSGIMTTVAGWGYTQQDGGQIPNVLQKVDVPLVSKNDCNASTSYNGTVTDSMICAGLPEGGKDACQGDSGGPLMITKDGKTSLIGVVSWGQGCAQANYYGVYAKVNAVTDWIDQTTAASN